MVHRISDICKLDDFAGILYTLKDPMALFVSLLCVGVGNQLLFRRIFSLSIM